MPIGLLWQTLLEAPLINFLVALSALAFGSFGLAILLFTVIARVVTFPLTLRMLHSMRGMQDLNPKIQEIQKKYSDPKRRTEETMKLYREAGVNPLGCLGGQIIQIPLFLALYQVIRITLGGNPEALILLEQRLYKYDFLQHAIPLSNHFVGMDLSAPRNLPLVLIVVASMWLQQRISTSHNAGANASQSAQQQQMTKMMGIYMPFIFGVFAFTAPAGLALYWSATTIIGIVLQWVFVGPGDFTFSSLVPEQARSFLGLPPSGTRSPHHSSSGGATGAASAATEDNQSESRSQNGSSRGGQRSRRRGRGGSGTSSTRPQSRPGGDRGGQGR
ncbi:MAG: membrane protein insertase YidC [Dehalococcoidia bacterium]|nr:membrane protein insertase YidC [Dehalococcoidia bacterium]